MKTMAKTKQSNLIASVKMLHIGVINKDTINLGIWGAIQYYLISSHSSQFFFHYPPPKYFSL